MKKPRPPRAPYCLCGSLRRGILQQVSPSRHSMYYFSGANRRANAYFAKVKDYHTKLMQYREENGQLRELTVTITLSEYRELVASSVLQHNYIDQIDDLTQAVDFLCQVALELAPELVGAVQPAVKREVPLAVFEALLRVAKDGDADA